MTYKSTLRYLFSKLPMYQKKGKVAFKKDLTNIIALTKHLGDPHKKFKSIHIAGTNGKGSVAHGIAAIFQKKGYKTGLYTSPHYKNFRERIKINGEFITEEEVINFVELIKPQIEAIKPSFFEISVAMAFNFFAEENVDIAIIETGLGGRLDSTNIIKPELSIITNIAFDHTEMLGNTIEEIAREKAGIIKENTPVVIGESHSESDNVFIELAEKNNSEIYFADKELELNNINLGLKESSLDISKDGQLIYDNLKSDLTGPFQFKNIRTIIQAAELFSDINFPFTRQQKKEALLDVRKSVKFMGRWQILQNENPLIITDSAHNAHGIKLVIDEINKMDFNQLHIVFGMVRDKDEKSILPFLPKNAKYYFCKPDIPRGLPVSALINIASKYNLSGEDFISVENAILAAKENAAKTDLIFIGGSTFVVAEAI